MVVSIKDGDDDVSNDDGGGMIDYMLFWGFGNRLTD